MVIFLLAAVFFGFGFLASIFVLQGFSTVAGDPVCLTVAASQNPSIPVDLLDDSCVSEIYPFENVNYYYKTYDMSSDDYHLIWLNTQSMSNDFDLVLYPNASYISDVAYSNSGGSNDWIVYRPSSSNAMYPKVWTWTGTGYGYIEAESGRDITVGETTYTGDILTDNEIGDLFEVYLTNGTNYIITSYGSVGADFDLYLYRLDSGSGTNNLGYLQKGILASPTSNDKKINYTASVSDYYAIVVIRNSGSGYASVTVQNPAAASEDIPGFELVPVIIGFALVGAMIVGIRKTKNNNHPFFLNYPPSYLGR